ncbi:MAG: GAF domain-containing protein, partial [Dehalococcoidia bacterium]|nr:GAF domain-containing protein [Dehalococcoidia bacterium]
MEAGGPSEANQADQLTRENAELRGRLARLREIGLRINESLDPETVLQGVLESACALTEARYGVIIILDYSGQIQDYLSYGMSAAELADAPGGLEIFRHLHEMPAPIRLRDFGGHFGSLGIPEFSPPPPINPAFSFLGAPIQH